MDKQTIRTLFSTINIWKRHGERAPHKPLLLLYALAKCSRGETRYIPYTEIDSQLRYLLMEFGPSRTTYHTEYPFTRLQHDALWELRHAGDLIPRQSNTDPKKTELLRKEVSGGFLEAIYITLQHDRHLLEAIVLDLLNAHFPESMHEDILSAVGLELDRIIVTRRRRDAVFRKKVLMAYQHRCAICQFDIQIGRTLIGLEAAHIQWHQAGGPDIESNGLALCVMHHKLFDRGAFTINHAFQIVVSHHVHGSEGLYNWLLRFEGALISLPVLQGVQPNAEYLDWHALQVFRAPARGNNFIEHPR